MSRPTELCLVRHGETAWNRDGRYQGTSDIPLNDLGHEQARLGAERLADEPWDAIVSSPLARAKSTAEAIAAATGLDGIEFLVDLQERAYGDAEGLTIAERDERWPEGMWPNLESVEHVWKRAERSLQVLAKTYAGKRIVVVSHGGLINAMLHVASNGELGTGISRILNVSLTRLHSDDLGASWEIDVISDAEHLMDEHGKLNVLIPANVDAAGVAAARSGI